MFATVDIQQGVDIAFVAIMLLACMAGSVRGASGEISRLLSLVCGVAAAYVLNGAFRSSFNLSAIMAAAAAIAVGVVVALLANVVARKFIRLIFGQPADAIAGAVMSVAGALIICVLLLCVAHLLVGEETGKAVFEDSFAGKSLAPAVRRIVEKFYN